MENVDFKIINGRPGEPITVRTRGRQDIENSSIVLHKGHMPASRELNLQVPIDYIVVEARGDSLPANLLDDPTKTTVDLNTARERA